MTIVETLGFKLLFRQFEGWGFDGHELWGERNENGRNGKE